MLGDFNDDLDFTACNDETYNTNQRVNNKSNDNISFVHSNTAEETFTSPQILSTQLDIDILLHGLDSTDLQDEIHNPQTPNANQKVDKQVSLSELMRGIDLEEFNDDDDNEVPRNDDLFLDMPILSSVEDSEKYEFNEHRSAEWGMQEIRLLLDGLDVNNFSDEETFLLNQVRQAENNTTTDHDQECGEDCISNEQLHLLFETLDIVGEDAVVENEDEMCDILKWMM